MNIKKWLTSDFSLYKIGFVLAILGILQFLVFVALDFFGLIDVGNGLGPGLLMMLSWMIGGLLIEVRREVGEEYSVFGGAMRSFEITHIWATEKDLVTRRDSSALQLCVYRESRGVFAEFIVHGPGLFARNH
ncbi:MAG: hypothetical protein O3A57_00785 [Bacteroidetes bacterium]|nr:hypothetical protein [Bacteroidota bacterium]